MKYNQYSLNIISHNHRIPERFALGGTSKPIQRAQPSPEASGLVEQLLGMGRPQLLWAQKILFSRNRVSTIFNSCFVGFSQAALTQQFPGPLCVGLELGQTQNSAPMGASLHQVPLPPGFYGIQQPPFVWI